MAKDIMSVIQGFLGGDDEEKPRSARSGVGGRGVRDFPSSSVPAGAKERARSRELWGTDEAPEAEADREEERRANAIAPRPKGAQRADPRKDELANIFMGARPGDQNPVSEFLRVLGVPEYQYSQVLVPAGNQIDDNYKYDTSIRRSYPGGQSFSGGGTDEYKAGRADALKNTRPQLPRARDAVSGNAFYELSTRDAWEDPNGENSWDLLSGADIKQPPIPEGNELIGALYKALMGTRKSE